MYHQHVCIIIWQGTGCSITLVGCYWAFMLQSLPDIRPECWGSAPPHTGPASPCTRRRPRTRPPRGPASGIRPGRCTRRSRSGSCRRTDTCWPPTCTRPRLKRRQMFRRATHPYNLRLPLLRPSVFEVTPVVGTLHTTTSIGLNLYCSVLRSRVGIFYCHGILG